MDKNWPDTSMPKSLNIERKTAAKNPTAEMMKIMVKNAVQCTQKPKGASVDDVCKHIESKYDMKVLKSCVNEALTEGVNTGTFQKVNEQYFLRETASRRRDFDNIGIRCPDPKLNDAPTSESLNPDIKVHIKDINPEIVNRMVKNAIKFSKKPNGTSLEGVCKYIEDNYEVKVSIDCIYKVLNEGVSAGTFEKINGEYFLKKEIFRREGIEDMDIDFPDPKRKDAFTAESLNPKSKTVIATPGMVNAMVKNAVKYLKKPNGSSPEDICKYIEDTYEVKVSKDCVNEVLREGVSVGIFEKISGEYFLDNESSRRKVFVEERFKMSEEKREGLDKKAEIPTLTREMIIMMVKYSIKNLKKANGASLVDIRSYMEEYYRVNIKFFEFSVGHILNDMVNHGVLVKMNGAGDVERFKIKE